MRQQIPQPLYGVGFLPQLQQISQPTIKIVSQHPFQIQPIVQQPYQFQQQTSFSQQSNRPIIPINDNANVCRPTAWNHSLHQRFYTSQFNVQSQNQMQVINLHQIEEPWKMKVQELQNRIKVLQTQQLKKQDQDEESELSQAYSQIQQLINTIKILQEEIQQFQEKIETKQHIIDGYDKQLSEKDKEIDDANHYISELHAQLEDQNANVEEKQKYLIDEVSTWKKKFIEQNKEFHKKQEELMTLQAELDNLKNQQIIINKSSDYKQNK